MESVTLNMQQLSVLPFMCGQYDSIRFLVYYITLYQINGTPLYWACYHGYHEVVQSLLGSGADVNIAIMPEVSDVMYCTQTSKL